MMDHQNRSKTRKNDPKTNRKCNKKIALAGVEPTAREPESLMFDHYTKGLQWEGAKYPDILGEGLRSDT